MFYRCGAIRWWLLLVWGLIGSAMPVALGVDTMGALKDISAMYTAQGYESSLAKGDWTSTVGGNSYDLQFEQLRLSRGMLGWPIEEVEVSVYRAKPDVLLAYFLAKRRCFEEKEVADARKGKYLNKVMEVGAEGKLNRQVVAFDAISSQQWGGGVAHWNNYHEQEVFDGKTIIKKALGYDAYYESVCFTEDFIAVAKVSHGQTALVELDKPDSVIRVLSSVTDLWEYKKQATRAVQTVLGSSLDGTLELVQRLTIEALPSSLETNGEDRADICIQAIQQVLGQAETMSPIAGKTVKVSVLPQQGVVPGTLSETTLVTDASGKARTSFVAPLADLIEGKDINTAQIQVACEGFNSESVHVALQTCAGLQFSAKYAILPAHHAYANVLQFTFGASDENLITAWE